MTQNKHYNIKLLTWEKQINFWREKSRKREKESNEGNGHVSKRRIVLAATCGRPRGWTKRRPLLTRGSMWRNARVTFRGRTRTCPYFMWRCSLNQEWKNQKKIDGSHFDFLIFTNRCYCLLMSSKHISNQLLFFASEECTYKLPTANLKLLRQWDSSIVQSFTVCKTRSFVSFVFVLVKIPLRLGFTR